MKINIKATNLELNLAIRDYLEKKLFDIQKLLNAPDEAVLIEVELAKENRHHKQGEDMFRAEANLSAPGRQFYAVASSADLYASIDELKDILSGEIKARSEKRNTVLRRSGRRVKEMLRGGWEISTWPIRKLRKWRR